MTTPSKSRRVAVLGTQHQRPGFRLLNFAIVALAFGLLPAADILAADGTHEIEFRLVPSSGQVGGEEEADASDPREYLTDGVVHLYRAGSFEAELTVPINIPVEVPSGKWTWVGEAPGYVTVGSGILNLGDEAVKKAVVWPAVPACALKVSQREWQGISRLDVVSLDYDATFVFDVGERNRLPVPAGRLIAYTVGSRGVEAISPLLQCEENTSRPLDRPSPPAADRQDFMVTALVEEGRIDDVEIFAATLRPLATPDDEVVPISPTASVGAEEWATFFFLNVSAENTLRLEIEHPQFRTSKRTLEPLPGEVREITGLELKPRITAEVPVDYQPLRDHERATVSVILCEADEKQRIEDCDPVGEAKPLERGFQILEFEGLDVGRVVLDTRIDDERILGHGSGVTPELRGGDPENVVLPRHLMKEFRIYGHLLVDDEPVPGEVRLQSRIPGRFSARSFPTREDDLTYNIYYFGKLLSSRFSAMFPAELMELPEDERYGIPLGTVRVEACDFDGFCKPFHIWSTFTGSGRYDVDLGSGRWLVRVVDGATGRPIPGATVFVRSLEQQVDAVHVFAGQKLSSTRTNAEALDSRADEEGLVHLRGFEGSVGISASASGYQKVTKSLQVPVQDHFELTVELMPEEEEPGLAKLVFTDGSPAAGALLASLAPDGEPAYRCSPKADSLGQVDFPDGCFAQVADALLVWHPAARFQRMPKALVGPGAQIEIEPMRGRPLRVRLLEADGTPLAGVPVGLRFSDITLGPNHLILANKGGVQVQPRTNERGEVTFPFLSATGPLPELLLPELDRSYPLFPAEGGGVIEVFLDP